VLATVTRAGGPQGSEGLPERLSEELGFGDGWEVTPDIVLYPVGDPKVPFGELAWGLGEGGPLATEDTDRRGD
jgi:hypothetical protein